MIIFLFVGLAHNFDRVCGACLVAFPVLPCGRGFWTFSSLCTVEIRCSTGLTDYVDVCWISR